MKRSNLFLFVFLFYNVSLIFAQQEDVLNLPSKVVEYQKIITDLSNKQKELDSLYQDQVNSSKLEIEKAKSTSDKLSALEGKIKALEIYNQNKEVLFSEQMQQRYKAGRDALKDMTNGVVLIGFMQDLLSLEVFIDMTMNLWSDTTFKNFWDDLQRYGSGLGLLASGASIISDKNQINNIAAIGISVAGVSFILGSLFGEDKGEKLREKAEFIDLTRRAYDDLKIRYYLVQKYVQNNESLEKRLNDFNNEYDKQKTSLGDSVQVISQVKLFYQEYEIVLRQIPSLLDEFESMQRQYVMTNPKMKKIFDEILIRVNKVRNKYNDKVFCILDISTEIKRILSF